MLIKVRKILAQFIHNIFCTQYFAHNIFAHNMFANNIEIKRYYNKKIKDIFHPIFFSCVNWKYLFLDNVFWNLVWKYFNMSLQYFEEIFFIKMSFYLFITILWAKTLCVTHVGIKQDLYRERQFFKCKQSRIRQSCIQMRPLFILTNLKVLVQSVSQIWAS